MVRRNFTVDTLLELKDAGLIAASAAAQVSSSDQILNLGSGLIEGNVVIDISAIEIDTNNERYDILLQGSTKSDFADTIQDLAAVAVGANEVLNGDIDTAVGRIVLPFSNEFLGTLYPYVRAYTVVAGTIVSGINYTARIAKAM